MWAVLYTEVSVTGGSTVYKLFMGVKVIGSHVRTNKKLPATQAFCPEKWLAADRYNHLCAYDSHSAFSGQLLAVCKCGLTRWCLWSAPNE